MQETIKPKSAQARQKAPSHGVGAHDMTADLLIVGGGMVGCTLAIAAARGGLSSILVDRLALSAQVQSGFDGRSSAIARGSQQVLAGIGLWPMVADDAEAIQEIRVSDGRPGASAGLAWASPLFLHYDSAVLDGAPLGYIVENRVLRQACAAKVSGLAEITYCAPESLAALERQGGAITARLEDGRSLRASLVVSAEGRFSSLREAAGIATRRWDYPQAAIVCSVGHELPHGGVAHEHFLPSGPFALLPMTDGPLVEAGQSGHRSSLVWTEDRSIAAEVIGADDAAFARELTRRFGDSLGRLWVEGKRWQYPLSLLHADHYHDRRLALVGDAAHAIHPIAGQGLNLGIRDVAALVEALVDARRLGLDIGAADVLERYQRWRRFDTMALVLATDGLNRLFSNDLGPLRLARDLGLAAVNRLPPAKRFFMRQAMGLVGDLPRLVRGEPL
jgi:2-octaprenyl-6-methoxyphenol hydroxylase